MVRRLFLQQKSDLSKKKSSPYLQSWSTQILIEKTESGNSEQGILRTHQIRCAEECNNSKSI